MLKHMTKQIREARENESGFTLIELLIVIVILGVLAAIVVFAVSGITDRGKHSACKADVSTVDTASEAYYAKNGDYAADMAALVSGGFLHAVPTATDAANGYHVVYVASNVGADNTVCPA
jgi:prepilin-type N-terminal cleavage/methylation domain-containing protein